MDPISPKLRKNFEYDKFVEKYQYYSQKVNTHHWRQENMIYYVF